jgi:hypothetical protein
VILPDLRVEKAYILHREDYPINSVASAALHGFQELGIETAPIHGFGDIQELTDLGPTVMVEGWLQTVWEALERVGIKPPPPLDYPEELRPFLGRDLWTDTLGNVRQGFQKVFVKPLKAKLFTGIVWDGGLEARRRTVTCEDSTKVWVSSTIEFKSEFRAFILDGRILDVRRYKGEWWHSPSRKVVEAAVKRYKSAPRAYCLDFGVTKDRFTCLVEANDGYAFGHYGLHHVLLARMLAARWEELTNPLV